MNLNFEQFTLKVDNDPKLLEKALDLTERWLEGHPPRYRVLGSHTATVKEKVEHYLLKLKDVRGVPSWEDVNPNRRDNLRSWFGQAWVDDVFSLSNTPENQPTQTTPKEATTMATTYTADTTKPFTELRAITVYGKDINECSEEYLIDAIRKVNEEISKLSSVTEESSYLSSKVASLKVARGNIIKALDEKGEKA